MSWLLEYLIKYFNTYKTKLLPQNTSNYYFAYSGATAPYRKNTKKQVTSYTSFIGGMAPSLASDQINQNNMLKDMSNFTILLGGKLIKRPGTFSWQSYDYYGLKDPQGFVQYKNSNFWWLVDGLIYRVDFGTSSLVSDPYYAYFENNQIIDDDGYLAKPGFYIKQDASSSGFILSDIFNFNPISPSGLPSILDVVLGVTTTSLIQNTQTDIPFSDPNNTGLLNASGQIVIPEDSQEVGEYLLSFTYNFSLTTESTGQFFLWNYTKGQFVIAISSISSVDTTSGTLNTKIDTSLVSSGDIIGLKYDNNENVDTQIENSSTFEISIYKTYQSVINSADQFYSFFTTTQGQPISLKDYYTQEKAVTITSSPLSEIFIDTQDLSTYTYKPLYVKDDIWSGGMVLVVDSLDPLTTGFVATSISNSNSAFIGFDSTDIFDYEFTPNGDLIWEESVFSTPNNVNNYVFSFSASLVESNNKSFDNTTLSLFNVTKNISISNSYSLSGLNPVINEVVNIDINDIDFQDTIAFRLENNSGDTIDISTDSNIVFYFSNDQINYYPNKFSFNYAGLSPAEYNSLGAKTNFYYDFDNPTSKYNKVINPTPTYPQNNQQNSDVSFISSSDFLTIFANSGSSVPNSIKDLNGLTFGTNINGNNIVLYSYIQSKYIRKGSTNFEYSTTNDNNTFSISSNDNNQIAIKHLGTGQYLTRANLNTTDLSSDSVVLSDNPSYFTLLKVNSARTDVDRVVTISENKTWTDVSTFFSDLGLSNPNTTEFLLSWSDALLFNTFSFYTNNVYLLSLKWDYNIGYDYYLKNFKDGIPTDYQNTNTFYDKIASGSGNLDFFAPYEELIGDGKTSFVESDEKILYWKAGNRILMYPIEGNGWELDSNGDIYVDPITGKPKSSFTASNREIAWIELPVYQPNSNQFNQIGNNMLSKNYTDRVIKFISTTSTDTTTNIYNTQYLPKGTNLNLYKPNISNTTSTVYLDNEASEQDRNYKFLSESGLYSCPQQILDYNESLEYFATRTQQSIFSRDKDAFEAVTSPPFVDSYLSFLTQDSVPIDSTNINIDLSTESGSGGWGDGTYSTGDDRFTYSGVLTYSWDQFLAMIGSLDDIQTIKFNYKIVSIVPTEPTGNYIYLNENDIWEGLTNYLRDNINQIKQIGDSSSNSTITFNINKRALFFQLLLDSKNEHDYWLCDEDWVSSGFYLAWYIPTSYVWFTYNLYTFSTQEITIISGGTNILTLDGNNFSQTQEIDFETYSDFQVFFPDWYNENFTTFVSGGVFGTSQRWLTFETDALEIKQIIDGIESGAYKLVSWKDVKIVLSLKTDSNDPKDFDSYYVDLKFQGTIQYNALGTVQDPSPFDIVGFYNTNQVTYINQQAKIQTITKAPLFEDCYSRYYQMRVIREEDLDASDPNQTDPNWSKEYWYKGNQSTGAPVFFYTFSTEESFLVYIYAITKNVYDSLDGTKPDDSVLDVDNNYVDYFQTITPTYDTIGANRSNDIVNYELCDMYFYLGQLFVFYGNKIWVSDFKNYGYFPYTYILTLGRNEGTVNVKAIRGFQSVSGNIVFTDHSIYSLKGQNPTNFELTLINGAEGLSASLSAQNVQNYIYFLGKSGILSLVNSSVSADAENTNVRLLSVAIQNQITRDDINSASAYWSSMYYISFDRKNDNGNYEIYIYNVDTGSWSRWESPYFDIMMFYVYDNLLYMVRKSTLEVLRLGYLYKFLTTTGGSVNVTNGSVDITPPDQTQWTTKWNTLGFLDRYNTITNSGIPYSSYIETPEYTISKSITPHNKAWKKFELTMTVPTAKTEVGISLSTSTGTIQEAFTYDISVGNTDNNGALNINKILDPDTKISTSGSSFFDSGWTVWEGLTYQQPYVFDSNTTQQKYVRTISGRGTYVVAKIYHQDSVPISIDGISFVYKIKKAN